MKNIKFSIQIETSRCTKNKQGIRDPLLYKNILSFKSLFHIFYTIHTSALGATSHTLRLILRFLNVELKNSSFTVCGINNCSPNHFQISSVSEMLSDNVRGGSPCSPTLKQHTNLAFVVLLVLKFSAVRIICFSSNHIDILMIPIYLC